MGYPSYNFTLNSYQEQAERTASATPDIGVLTLGIAGEAGEVADIVKKHLGHGHPLDKEKLKKELGDVLWYVAALSGHLGLTLEEVAESNIEKLRKRYPDGFSSERSINRDDSK